MMKGLLKGLRQIANMFDAKEPEMQIGCPTDVKHVAHIGWDGPTINSPSWMNEFRSTNATSAIGTVNGSINELPVSPQLSSRDFVVESTAEASLPAAPLPTPKPSRRNASEAQNVDCDTTAVPKHSRRHQSQSDSRAGGESAEGSRRGRRERRTSEGGSDSSASSTTMQDRPGAPKQPRRRKGKDASSSGGSVRRSKGAATEQGSPLKPVDEDATEGQQC